MVFRFYILIMPIILGFVLYITLQTESWILGSIIILSFIILPPFGQVIRYRNWRKSQVNTEKSLAFGMQSISLQKQNFKAISYIFSRYTALEKFFKKLSIIFDDMHVEGRNYVWVSLPEGRKKH